MESTVQLDELSGIISANIAARRKELGISRADLAAAAKASEAYICMIESGKRVPSLEKITRIANKLRTTPNAILTPEIFSAPP